MIRELLTSFLPLTQVGGFPRFLVLLFGKGTLLLAAGWGLARALERSSPAARHLVWVVTLAALLLLPVLQGVAPPLPVPLLPARTPAAEPATASSEAVVPAPAASTATTRLAPSPSRDVIPTPAGRTTPASAGWSAGHLAAALYAGVAAALLGYLGLGLVRVRRLARRAQPLGEEPGWRSLLASLAAETGVRRRLTLLACRQARVPMAWGLRRPVVLLPAAARAWDEETRRQVLLHELVHLRRLDWPCQLLARLACALCWCHPLVWWATRRLALEAERACDERVLAAGASSEGYAARLLTLAGEARGRDRLSHAAVAMARPRGLAARVQSLLDGRRPRALGRSAAVAVALAALAPALLLAPARLVRAGEGLPPVMEAALRGDREEARALLAAGADPDAAFPGRGTPLIAAAGAGDLEMVRLLLASGADPDRTETAGRLRELPRSPLGAAARSGEVEVVAELLAAGARVDQAPAGDATPLMIAAEEGHLPVVEALLAADADVNRVVPGDGTALIAAVRGGRSEIADRLLAAGADPDRYVEGDESPLFHAVRRGEVELVHWLLEAGADPDAVWPGDGNALIVATRAGQEEIVDLLIRYGASVDQGVAGDGNALIEAAARGDLGLVERLLELGANPDRAVRGDGSPLIAAAAAGHLAVVRRLVEAGAPIDRVVPGDENALLQAAGAGHLAVVRYLLEQGADVHVAVEIPPTSWKPEGETRTALSMARRAGHQEVVKLLRVHGARE